MGRGSTADPRRGRLRRGDCPGRALEAAGEEGSGGGGEAGQGSEAGAGRGVQCSAEARVGGVQGRGWGGRIRTRGRRARGPSSRRLQEGWERTGSGGGAEAEDVSRVGRTKEGKTDRAESMRRAATFPSPVPLPPGSPSLEEVVASRPSPAPQSPSSQTDHVAAQPLLPPSRRCCSRTFSLFRAQEAKLCGSEREGSSAPGALGGARGGPPCTASSPPPPA